MVTGRLLGMDLCNDGNCGTVAGVVFEGTWVCLSKQIFIERLLSLEERFTSVWCNYGWTVCCLIWWHTNPDLGANRSNDSGLYCCDCETHRFEPGERSGNGFHRCRHGRIISDFVWRPVYLTKPPAAADDGMAKRVVICNN